MFVYVLFAWIHMCTYIHTQTLYVFVYTLDKLKIVNLKGRIGIMNKVLKQSEDSITLWFYSLFWLLLYSGQLDKVKIVEIFVYVYTCTLRYYTCVVILVHMFHVVFEIRPKFQRDFIFLLPKEVSM